MKILKEVQDSIDACHKLRAEENLSTREIAVRLGYKGNSVVVKKLKQKPSWDLPGAGTFAPAAPPTQPEIPADPIEVRRLKDSNARLIAHSKDLERRAVAAEDIRAGVLGLTSEPLVPRLEKPSHTKAKASGRTVVLLLSDVHYGETVSLEEMDGLNCYNVNIARARLGRFFDTAATLMTKFWQGDKPEEIVLCLGGDLVSGDIHAELTQTNYPCVPVAVKEVGEHIAGGIAYLREQVGCPIRVYSVPGNHGRLTFKPQSKGRGINSFDLLATDFVEATLRGTRTEGVTFHRAPSPDAYFSVYGWHWLLNHGDTMGSKGGGTGFIGPMASIIKGHRKLVDTSWRSGRPVHYVLSCHYHTTCKTPFGWGNGAAIGFGEYARDLRADPEPARQTMLVVHPQHGVIDDKPLYLGDPSEGSLYMGPTSVIRPEVEAA